MSAFVIGHMNPDTDSIISAIAITDLYKKLGKDVKAAAQGAPTPETKFVLDKFGLTAPEVVSDVAGKDLYLVDFSDLAQAPKGMDSANVLGIVDHHKLGDVTTNSPLLCWIWPAGCSCTVITNMYNFYGVEIPKDIAGGMLCAILSDTVIFKSVTCTPDDKKACEQLAKIAGVSDVKALGMEMYKVKSALEGATMTSSSIVTTRTSTWAARRLASASSKSSISACSTSTVMASRRKSRRSRAKAVILSSCFSPTS